MENNVYSFIPPPGTHALFRYSLPSRSDRSKNLSVKPGSPRGFCFGTVDLETHLFSELNQGEHRQWSRVNCWETENKIESNGLNPGDFVTEAEPEKQNRSALESSRESGE
ncbi:hypothetical protein Y032_0002g669 [Ancylostoma ceylanicum]|uniref:Uncharacterized protein n=1 Tax=Ancylostoma ceylanicum TaxID=53326 RepID=A0A016W0N1_9BILA|nr:hypothetical protein Y032_0002g669 [Ancylostoma ceylanicum]